MSLSASPFQFLHPLLKALQRHGQRLVAELMGVAEARQRGHSGMVLSAGDLETMPDDVDDAGEQDDDGPNSNIDHAETRGR